MDTVIFIACITILGLISLFDPDKPTESVQENRKLDEIPVFTVNSYLSGAYTSSLSSYYADIFTGREGLLQINRDIKRLFAIKKDAVIIITEETPYPSSTPIASPDETATPSPDTGSTPVISSPVPTESPTYVKASKIEVLVSPFLLVDGQVVGEIWPNTASLDTYITFMNELAAGMDEGVNVYSMVVPSHIEYFDLAGFESRTASQKDTVGYIADKTDQNVLDVDVYDALFSHCHEYIYYRTDHHWTHLGAYYAYCSLLETMGKEEEIIPLEDYTVAEVIEGYIGSGYRKTNRDERVLLNPDTMTAYYPIVGYTFMMYKDTGEEERRLNDMSYVIPNEEWYNMFMSTGSGRYHVFTTDVKNGSTLLLVSDSYGESMIHFLLPYYEKIIMIDSRYYDKAFMGGMTLDEYAKYIKADDIVVLQYMESVAYAFNTDALYSLLQ
ncbi:MAG: DHHW family protein [Clostridia bacterium]